MTFIDTGPFLARWLPRDQHHRAALAVWEKLGGSALYTSSHVVDETIKTSTLKDEDIDKLRQYQDLTIRLQAEVLADVEPHSVNHSYRTFFINIDALKTLEADIATKSAAIGRRVYIAMNIDAIGPTANLTYNTDDLHYIPIPASQATNDPARPASFFKANTTTLVEITISRLADDEIFKIMFDPSLS